MFGAKAEMALREKAIAFELTMVAYDRERGYEPLLDSESSSW